MGTSAHIAFDDLSALADGEIDRALRASAIEHLADCDRCAASYESIARLDDALRAPTPISCEAALPLLSALADHEADDAEVAVARAHAAECGLCAQSLVTFATLDLQLRALPHGAPSARVDRAVAALRERQGRIGVRLGLPRALVASVAALALVVGGLSRAMPATPLASDGGGDRAIVAAVQQVVFSASTNTLYVLDTTSAAVDARDGTTNEVKAHIQVGGRPTALALNESANTLLVLDSSQKKVTEIDTSANKVVSATTVDVAGTPTAISIDPNSSKIVVSSGASAKSNVQGSVAVIDSTTKKVETVRDFTAAPQAMVFSPNGDRAAVVASDATTILDSTYKTVATLPGGVAAAFAQSGGDRIAILTPEGERTSVSYHGADAPHSIVVDGKPRAITSLPDGGYLILVDIGDRSRVSYIVPDGHVAGSIDFAGKARGLLYDAASRRLSVAIAGEMTWAAIPETVVSAPSAPPSSAPASVSPSPTAAAPSPSPSASPSSVAATSPTPKPIDAAPSAGKDFVHLDLVNGRTPLAVSQSGERLWVLDDKNGIETIDLSTGAVSAITSLPRSADITQFVAGRAYLYALDERHGDLYVMPMFSAATPSIGLRLPNPVSSVVVGADDTLWMGLKGTSLLLRFEPSTKLTFLFDLNGAHISKLAADGLGRIFYSDDVRNAVGLLDATTGKTTELALPRHGVTTALTVDGSSTLWLGTSAGEIWKIRGGTYALTVALQRPVTTVSLDATGRAWYLSPLPSGAFGFAYASADGSGQAKAVSGPASSLSFNALGRAWLADPRGGFWVSGASQ